MLKIFNDYNIEYSSCYYFYHVHVQATGRNSTFRQFNTSLCDDILDSYLIDVSYSTSTSTFCILSFT